MRPHPSSGCTVLNVWQEGGGGEYHCYQSITICPPGGTTTTNHHPPFQPPDPVFLEEWAELEFCASHSHNRVIKWGAGGIDHYTELEDNEIIRTHKIGIRGSRFAQIKK